MQTLRVRFTQVDDDDAGMFYHGRRHKTYDYLYDGETQAEAGGFAVVKTSASAAPKVVRIEEVLAGATEKAVKHVVCVIDLTRWSEAEDARKRKAIITKRLREIEREVDDRTRFERLAVMSDEARVLLEELERL